MSTLGLIWFSPGRSGVCRAMAKQSWPFAVTSWKDTVKFAQLLFGVDVRYENYEDRLPHPSDKSFLLFAKGACAEGKPLCEIAEFIPSQLKEIHDWEQSFRGNHMRPTKSQQMLHSDGHTVYYWSAQVTRAPCVCRSGFGADAHQKHVPTSSASWVSGQRFQKLWDVTLTKNFAQFQNRDLRPVWLDKSWQVLWNWNDHNANHGIAPHSDFCGTYSSVDPITSLSFGRGGVLTLGGKKGAPTKMLFQEGGDALVMAGDFQAEFLHGVPARQTWKNLCLLPIYQSMKDWEKVGVQTEIALHEDAVPPAQHVRMNCTIRWHKTHWKHCPMETRHGDGTQPVVTGTVQRSSAEAAGSGSAEAAASAQRTQPVLTGAVRALAASGVDDRQVGAFSGIKKRGMDEASTPSVSTRKTPRSNNSDCPDEVLQPLLECIQACVEKNDLVRLTIIGLPLVAATRVHAETLARIDVVVKEMRESLRNASEAVQQIGGVWADKISFQSLNVMELAAKQRRMIHGHLGKLYNSENKWWLTETQVKISQNCLNKYTQYRKCLLSHRQLELLVETLSTTTMEKHQEIAFDLGVLQRGAIPLKFTCAKRHQHARQHQDEDLGLDAYEVAYDSVLLVKALEIGYVSDLDKATRLQTVGGAWKDLVRVMAVDEIIDNLKKGLLTLLQHLRTLDSEKAFCDRTDGSLASENYDIWVWMSKANP